MTGLVHKTLGFNFVNDSVIALAKIAGLMLDFVLIVSTPP